MSLRLEATLTHQEAPAWLDAVRPRLSDAGGKELAVDAAALRHFDSSAVAALLALLREASAAGRSLRIDNAPQPLRMLASVYGVEALLFPHSL